jgi:aerobic-type carbon monoxide dehydrogenase small subunit (CoxS/CutS family)
MTAYAVLRETPNPTEAQAREAISGNICRCTGYASIIQAILQASRGG